MSIKILFIINLFKCFLNKFFKIPFLLFNNLIIFINNKFFILFCFLNVFSFFLFSETLCDAEKDESFDAEKNAKKYNKNYYIFGGILIFLLFGGMSYYFFGGDALDYHTKHGYDGKNIIDDIASTHLPDHLVVKELPKTEMSLFQRITSGAFACSFITGVLGLKTELPALYSNTSANTLAYEFIDCCNNIKDLQAAINWCSNDISIQDMIINGLKMKIEFISNKIVSGSAIDNNKFNNSLIDLNRRLAEANVAKDEYLKILDANQKELAEYIKIYKKFYNVTKTTSKTQAKLILDAGLAILNQK